SVTWRSEDHVRCKSRHPAAASVFRVSIRPAIPRSLLPNLHAFGAHKRGGDFGGRRASVRPARCLGAGGVVSHSHPSSSNSARCLWRQWNVAPVRCGAETGPSGTGGAEATTEGRDEFSGLRRVNQHPRGLRSSNPTEHAIVEIVEESRTVLLGR